MPAYTAAAFAKRFARLALSAPPAGAILAIAFVHNLIRRHPSCMVLLHRPKPVSHQDARSTGTASTTQLRAADAPGACGGPATLSQQLQPSNSGQQQQAHSSASLSSLSSSDPYLPQEPDPALSRAVESSLWELTALRHHYCPQVCAPLVLCLVGLRRRLHACW